MAESSEGVLEVPMEDIDLGTRAELEYAGFWSRVAALIVDDAILIIVGLALLIGAASVDAELVVKAYTDTPGFLHPLAERSALAVLEKLIEEGRVRSVDGGYQRM